MLCYHPQHHWVVFDHFYPFTEGSQYRWCCPWTRLCLIEVWISCLTNLTPPPHSAVSLWCHSNFLGENRRFCGEEELGLEQQPRFYSVCNCFALICPFAFLGFCSTLPAHLITPNNNQHSHHHTQNVLSKISEQSCSFRSSGYAS